MILDASPSQDLLVFVVNVQNHIRILRVQQGQDICQFESGSVVRDQLLQILGRGLHVELLDCLPDVRVRLLRGPYEQTPRVAVDHDFGLRKKFAHQG